LLGDHLQSLGLTGTGGAGKSSVTDEILSRLLRFFPERRIAVLAVDPTRRRTGGALLGDRIRMNSLISERLYMRSMATRRQHLATNEMLGDVILFLKSLGFDMVIVETAGIGQSDSEIVDLVDFSVYVMTSEYGAASQLEKIDMLDFADMIILNKFDKRGAEDALRDVRKQWRRNHNAFDVAEADIPVFPSIASQFNDPGVNWAFRSLCMRMSAKLKLPADRWEPAINTDLREPKSVALIPGNRQRYLAEIAEGEEREKFVSPGRRGRGKLGERFAAGGAELRMFREVGEDVREVVGGEDVVVIDEDGEVGPGGGEPAKAGGGETEGGLGHD
jgi:methylmalonyl-CoA mutase